MEKPSKVEVGQRWQTSYGDVWCVISVDSPLRVRRERDGYECNTGLSWFANPHLTYLGPAEPVKAPAPAMEAKLDVWGDLVPVACLSCAGALDSTRAFVCQTCFPSVANNGKWVELRRAWQAGARDFPRPASPPSQPMTGPTKTIAEQLMEIQSALGPPILGLDAWLPKPSDQFAVPGEFRYGGLSAALPKWTVGIDLGRDEAPGSIAAALIREGATVPATARQLIQAKERASQEKREEDARAVAAFCNDFDLLPDAP